MKIVDFLISDIVRHASNGNITGAAVEFKLQDDIDGKEFFQTVTVDVFVDIPPTTTLSELEEKILTQAKHNLNFVLTSVSGKSAQTIHAGLDPYP